MSIRVKNNIFYLETPGTSYVFGLYRESCLVHFYYGARIGGDIDPEKCIANPAFRQGTAWDVDGVPSGAMTMEYPTFGSPDLREPGIHLRHADGSTVTRFAYRGYEIKKGKPALAGLPSAYVESEEEADTLEVSLFDELWGLSLILSYTVYNTADIITKHVRLANGGTEPCHIARILSTAFDMPNDDYRLVTLSGAWARECHIHETPVFFGYTGVDSKKGASSHQHNPFLALAGKTADERQGSVYGFSLVYSGNFRAGIELDEMNSLRTLVGINDFNFGWELLPGDEFTAPEVVLTYSAAGFGGMSRTLHKFVRTRVCRGKFRDERRPILLNNWEATYFDFSEEKLIAIAEKAKAAGIELFVLDDGWFGKRNSDNCSLGDWFPNREKLPSGIDGLARRINALGLKFGLWFEPEMISADSDLYRAHPDWCIHVANRPRNEFRNQLTLDLSRADVCDYIIDVITKNLTEADISYVKWDMNRHMSEVGSALLSPERQCELYHRYMLGLYRVLDTVMTRFPDVLFEGCSSGGGRFDLGMLAFFPQFWTSDDTDAIERLSIQYGTSLAYPASAMGAHVSAVPNHQVHRVCSVKTRGDVAMLGGAFGYELDLNTLTDEEFETVREQIQYAKKYSAILREAEMYRLKSPFDSNFAVFEMLSEDRTHLFLLIANLLGEPYSRFYNVKLEGLPDDAVYRDEESGECYRGDFLKNVGLFFDNKRGDFQTILRTFKKIS